LAYAGRAGAARHSCREQKIESKKAPTFAPGLGTAGGLALSRPLASAVIGAFIIACLLIFPQRAGQHPQAPE
jgi:hypothetical protein